jgi:aminopeptidase N
MFFLLEIGLGTAVAGPMPSTDRLVNTKLSLSFDYARHLVRGKAWITIDPQAPSDSLVLDARSMSFSRVQLSPGEKSLSFVTTGNTVCVRLDRRRHKGEQYTIFFDYTARPDSQATASVVTQSRGIYFVKDGADYQVWTQGETTGASAWFPTIDQPDQRSRAEIALTVPSKYETLSNGVLGSRRRNPDGTRTDSWVMDQPHAPYLFMLAIGKFTVHHDRWNGIPVDYYMEPAYSSAISTVFGRTPEMLQYFSLKLDYPYPWPKYAQVVVKDYFSGGMENTTATLFGSMLRRKPRSFIGDDEARWVVPHELFHHWFGDLVTCKSWSALTLNEAMATYGEVLWGEHAFGQEAADNHAYESMLAYFELAREGGDHPLINPAYDEASTLFDAVTYQKGAAVLNMLRDLVGDSVFFRSLHTYLTVNAYHSVTETDLQQAFEKESGQDLGWFWEQWFYRKGYPQLDIKYNYDDNKGVVAVTIEQKQPGQPYRLPMLADIYSEGRRQRMAMVDSSRSQVFSFNYPDGHTRPQLVNIDASKRLLCRKTDHKGLEAAEAQYRLAPGYYNRREALIAFILAQDSSEAARLALVKGLKDSSYALRQMVAGNLNLDKPAIRTLFTPLLDSLVRHDGEPLVRQAAVKKLRGLQDRQYIPLLITALTDSSYDVVASALIGLNGLDRAGAAPYVRQFADDEDMASTLMKIFLTNKDAADNATFLQLIERQDQRQKQESLKKYLRYLSTLTDTAVVEQGLKRFHAIAATIDPQFLDQPDMKEDMEMAANITK